MQIRRYTALWAVMALLIAALSGCSHNNGDIGQLFGTWKLQTITISGNAGTTQDNPIYEVQDVEDMFWAFQTSVIMMKRMLPNHDTSTSWGTWSRTGDNLMLDFSHSDNANPAGSYKYSIPKGYHLPPDGALLEIKQLTEHRMVLVLHTVNPDSPVSEAVDYSYYFEKW